MITGQAPATKSSMPWLAAQLALSWLARARARSSAGSSTSWKYRAETRLKATNISANSKSARMLESSLLSFHQQVISS